MTVIAAEMVPRALKDASLGASWGGALLSLILVHSLQFHLKSVRSSRVQHKAPSRRKSQDHFTVFHILPRSFKPPQSRRRCHYACVTSKDIVALPPACKCKQSLHLGTSCLCCPVCEWVIVFLLAFTYTISTVWQQKYL